MKRKVVWRGVLLALIALGVIANALYADPNPNRFEGIINDFSPATTSPAGPYLVSGPWSLKLHPNGKAVFTASLTMVRPNPADPESESSRNFHTHHVVVTEGEVSIEGSAMVVTGTALIMSNGNQVFPGSTVRVEITGGAAVSVSNMNLTFNGGAAGHFTNQPYDGVVLIQRFAK